VLRKVISWQRKGEPKAAATQEIKLLRPILDYIDIEQMGMSGISHGLLARYNALRLFSWIVCLTRARQSDAPSCSSALDRHYSHLHPIRV